MEIYIIFIMAFVFAIIVGAAIILHLLVAIKAKESTTATIIDIKERRYNDRGHLTVTYLPVFEYYVNGKKYITESSEGEPLEKYNIGKQIKINYRKENPNDAYISEDKKYIIKFSIMALLFLLVFITFFVIEMVLTSK